MRACPYCNRHEAKFFGKRGSATFVRCVACSSIHMDLTPSEFATLHANAFADAGFAADMVDARALQPARDTWNQFCEYFPDGPFLEIGPGSGHLLAAANETNRNVYGVEASATHRDFISRTWGIRNVFPSLADLPASAPRFATVAMFNTIEHVFDVAGLFESIRSRLMPGGSIFVSTCNAECIILPIVGPYWSMFKVPDHVSIPSAKGFRKLAARTGLECKKTWTGELPLETPIGLAVAFRDWMRERRTIASSATDVIAGDQAQVAPNMSGSAKRRAMRRVFSLAENVDPTRFVTSKIGRAAAVRAVFA
jgi:2-polyprenyl-3-methyl-5-hydroxy-6-metoxy-1,4-benzoquinol methylase